MVAGIDRYLVPRLCLGTADKRGPDVPLQVIAKISLGYGTVQEGKRFWRFPVIQRSESVAAVLEQRTSKRLAQTYRKNVHSCLVHLQQCVCDIRDTVEACYDAEEMVRQESCKIQQACTSALECLYRFKERLESLSNRELRERGIRVNPSWSGRLQEIFLARNAATHAKEPFYIYGTDDGPEECAEEDAPPNTYQGQCLSIRMGARDEQGAVVYQSEVLAFLSEVEDGVQETLTKFHRALDSRKGTILMAEMTCRERLLTACRRGVPDRIPRAMGFEHGFAKVVRENLKREHPELDVDKLDFTRYFKLDPRHVGMNPTKKKGDFSKYFDRKDIEIGEWGCGRVWDETRHYAEYLYPLAKAETVAEIEAYPWPDQLEDYRYEGMADRVKALHNQGFAALGGPSALFELAWQIRSMERLMEDMLLNEEMAFAVYDHILECNCRYARECALAGVDILYLGDDVAMQQGLMMSLAVWRKYLGRGMCAMIGAAREIKPDILVWYHSDGDIAPLVPDLIDVGLDILNPVQPECCDAKFLKETYGHKLAFWGGLGVQLVLPFGKPDEVREHVRTQIEILGRNGGYVVAPSHVLERDTPWENFKAMVRAMDDFGQYT